MAQKKGLHIGVTIFIKADGDLGLWENGLRQNVVYLYHLFKASKEVEKVYLLNHGDGEPGEVPAFVGFTKEDIVRTKEVERKLDAVIVIGAVMDIPQVDRLRSRGCKVIKYKAGNGALISMEAMLNDPPRPDAERYFDHRCYDVIWMTPQHIHSNKAYCETIYRCPVIEVPQIWQPLFIETRAHDLGQPYGFDPEVRTNKIAILEPNINVLKTSHIPMLVCDEAYRKKPELLDHVFVFNSVQLPALSKPFSAFCGQLEMVKVNKMTVEGRFATADIMIQHANAVVTHHWENGLNYLYYDVLYGGFPLIHNSEFIKDYGYYYPDFNPIAGGDVLLEALENHRERLDEYKDQAKVLLDRVSATASGNVDLHVNMVKELL